MAQNRTLPFGYKIENGAIIVNHAEAQVVRTVFCEYGKGASYKSIAASLTIGNVPYMPNKPVWNKNMVARLLQNKRYLGTERHPAIITMAEWQKVQQAQKPYTHTESAELKEIKPYLICHLCGKPIKRRLKHSGEPRWFCEESVEHIALSVTDELLVDHVSRLIRGLVHQPQMAIHPQEKSNSASIAQIRLHNEIESQLEQGEFDENILKEKIYALAAERYTLCDETSVMTNWLVCTLKETVPDTWMKTDLLKQILDQIEVDTNGGVTLMLKNGQRIGKEA